jgi:hypothetical protein
MNVKLHIERLVLEGLDIAPGQRRLLRAAVETELTRLLAEGGLAPQLSSGVALPSLRAGAIQLTNETGATHLGAQIAGAVYGGIGVEATAP